MSALHSVLPGTHIIRVRGPELLSKYIGASEEAVRQVFEEASKNRPSLICFDEFDSLAPRRGHDNTGVTDRVVNQLLTEIDGTGEKEGVFIVATTSRKDMIDPAILRSGRIDQHVSLKLPDASLRAKILSSLLPGVDEATIGSMAEMTEGATISHLKGLIYDSQIDRLKASMTDEAPTLTSLVMDKLSKMNLPASPPITKTQRATFA